MKTVLGRKAAPSPTLPQRGREQDAGASLVRSGTEQDAGSSPSLPRPESELDPVGRGRPRPDLQRVIDRHALTLDTARPEAVAKRHALGLRTAREIARLMRFPTVFHVYRRLDRLMKDLRRALDALGIEPGP